MSGPVGDDVTHLVIGPTDHGVVRFGRRLAALMGASAVHERHPEQVDEALLARHVHPHTVAVQLQYTDALYAAHTTAAARIFTDLRRRIQAPVTVTLHDLPDPGDEPGRYHRRARSYREVALAVDAVAVSSRHELALLERLLRPGEEARDVVRAVVPLPIPTPVILPDGERPAPLPEVAVFGFVYPGKGHEDVIRAMAGLPAQVRFTALGRTADGHQELAGHLSSVAGSVHRSMTITGFVPDESLGRRLRRVAVPVVPARTISASGSINTWIEAGRRPLAVTGPYTREFAERYPGAIHLYRPEELPDLIRAVRARPQLSWLREPLPVHLSGAAVAAGYAELVRGVRERTRVR